MATPLTLKDFFYELPESLVAQVPLANRDAARLLEWKQGLITHSYVKDLSQLVPAGSLFIVNDSKVIASRIRFQLPTGAQAEFLLLEPISSEPNGTETWLALGRPMRKIKTGVPLHVGNGLTVTVLEGSESDAQGPKPVTIRVSKQGPALLDWLAQFGEMPLPPYIERRGAGKTLQDEDKIRYQTVYANLHGSVAAPTAGLHFTSDIIESLKLKGCSFAAVTLHVGAGTFLPVKASNISEHVMHEERYLVPRQTLEAIDQAKKEGRSVIVVGTTALRSLEGLEVLATSQGREKIDLADQWHRTNIFVRPEFKESRFRSWVADALMTNFHQPESTLVMLVSALIGYDNVKTIYKEAIERSYRFFSYGDSSLLWLDK